MNVIFRFSNFLVVPFWVMIIALPRWRWTERIMKSPLVSMAPALVYGTLVVPHLLVIWPVIARPALGGVAQLLGSPSGATIAWLHFLAFDLFVGRWIYLDSRERCFSSWIISPTLFLTLMLGPLGFLLYLAVRIFIQEIPPREASAGIKANLSVHATRNLFRAGMLSRFSGRLQRGFTFARPLTILGWVMILAFLGTLVGVIFDPRIITGAPAWLKPAKFSISVSVYCFTLVWLLSFLETRPRFVRIVTRTIVFSLAAEMIVIITQAARGTTSHFNMSTPLNSFLWITMGAFIMVVWLMTLVVAVMLIRQPMSNRAFAWSLRFGLVISLLGMATGFFMVRPTPQQHASARGMRPKDVGAHCIGVADGGPGLPILGWSTVGGDMRVTHFVGLHGLQVLPLLGWLITRNRRRQPILNGNDRLGLIWTAALAYTGVVVLLMWQALRGESVIHPDRTIITLAGALILVTAISVGAVIRGALVERSAQLRTRMEMSAN